MKDIQLLFAGGCAAAHVMNASLAPAACLLLCFVMGGALLCTLLHCLPPAACMAPHPATCADQPWHLTVAYILTLDLFWIWLGAGRICGGREPPVTDRVPNCPRGVNRGYSQGVRQLVGAHLSLICPHKVA